MIKACKDENSLFTQDNEYSLLLLSAQDLMMSCVNIFINIVWQREVNMDFNMDALSNNNFVRYFLQLRLQ